MLLQINACHGALHRAVFILMPSSTPSRVQPHVTASAAQQKNTIWSMDSIKLANALPFHLVIETLPVGAFCTPICKQFPVPYFSCFCKSKSAATISSPVLPQLCPRSFFPILQVLSCCSISGRLIGALRKALPISCPALQPVVQVHGCH